MAKKSKKRETPVQFRPSDEFRAWLAKRAEKAGVTVNELVKQLATLARYELDVRHLKVVATLAEAMGSAFERAGEQVAVTLKRADKKSRKEHGHILPESERQELIHVSVKRLAQQLTYGEVEYPYDVVGVEKSERIHVQARYGE